MRAMTLVLGHRGGTWLGASENSLRAFGRALAVGADGVELDVRRTADDQLVVFHDPSTPVGPVADITLATLRAHVPEVALLDEALDTCRGSLVNIELKRAPDGRCRERVASLVMELLWARAADTVILSSFDPLLLTRARALAPGVPIALVTFVRPSVSLATTVVDHGCTALHLHVESFGRARATVDAAHAHGLAVHVWTVNRASHVRRLAAADVDGVITDHPHVALRALGRSFRGSDHSVSRRG
jgi:glycerophosphoryl diester phosphodiesterase